MSWVDYNKTTSKTEETKGEKQSENKPKTVIRIRRKVK